MKWAILGIAIATLANGTTPAKADCGLTSWYGQESGRRTADGKLFNVMGLSAAHRTLPLGTILKVCLASSPEKCVQVKVNDRGPARWTKRDLDLSFGAGQALGMIHEGIASVCWGRV